MTLVYASKLQLMTLVYASKHTQRQYRSELRLYINKIMKDFLKGNSKYKTIGKLIIISAATPNPIISILYMPIIGLMFRNDGEFWGLVGIAISIGQRCVYVH